MYGLPISVKECFFVKGYDATAGLARYIDSPAEEDGGMVKVSFPFCQNLCFLVNLQILILNFSTKSKLDVNLKLHCCNWHNV